MYFLAKCQGKVWIKRIKKLFEIGGPSNTLTKYGSKESKDYPTSWTHPNKTSKG
jgi:hypothetical protein